MGGSIGARLCPREPHTPLESSRCKRLQTRHGLAHSLAASFARQVTPRSAIAIGVGGSPYFALHALQLRRRQLPGAFIRGGDDHLVVRQLVRPLARGLVLVGRRGELYRIVHHCSDRAAQFRLHGIAPLTLRRPKGKCDVLLELGAPTQLNPLGNRVINGKAQRRAHEHADRAARSGAGTRGRRGER